MRRTDAGFTLVEMLVTAAILASVLVTAGTFLLTSNRSQRAAVDLGSSVDAHAFIASLLNYDFRIACYGVDSDPPCSLDLERSDGESSNSKVNVIYQEDRFGQSLLKEVTWSIDNKTHELIREEYVDVGNPYDISATVLRDVTDFTVDYSPSRPQLIGFSITRVDGTEQRINVAILNPMPVNGGD